MKKVNYYAVQGPWKMPKWIGFTLGGIFAVIFLSSAGLIVHLVRPASAAVALPADTAPAPVVAAAEPAAAPAAVEHPTAAAVEQPAAPANKIAHSKHGKARHAAKTAKAAPAKRGISDAKAHQILAKHDSKSNRKSKDDLDRLLGL